MLIFREDMDFDILQKFNFRREPISENYPDHFVWRFIDHTDGNRKLLIDEDSRALMILNWGPYNVSDAKLDIIFELIHRNLLGRVLNEDDQFTEDEKGEND